MAERLGPYKAGFSAGWLCAISILLLAGCGELSFKRGASATDFAQAKRECKSGNTEDSLNTCLKAKGWLLADLDSETSLADEDPVIHSTYQENHRAPTTPELKGDAVAKPASAARVKDSLDIFVVSSWWKAGQGARALNDDIAACVAELGNKHQPDPGYQRVTRGLLQCMRKDGWYALQAH